MFVILSPEDIAAWNARITGNPRDPAREAAAAACLSGFHYHDGIRLRIAAIVSSLVKGHFFLDGNKRTALSAYLVLCRANGIAAIEDDARLVEAFVELAASRMSVGECAALLFPGHPFPT